ncbi:MAG: MBL fold metallo-hydrolase [Acidimicrobiales bacterium]
MGRRDLALLAVPLVAAGGVGAWFYDSFLRRRVLPVGRDTYVVTGGGGNSLAVKRDGEVFLVDTKFGPGATSLKCWIADELGGPVTTILNTHYHYDHTQGNPLYPDADIWAHEGVPGLMRARDGEWWRTRERGIPTRLIGDGGRDDVVAHTEVVIRHPGTAHTHADLYAYLPEAELVATGDLLFHTYYPFFDTGPGGAAVPPLAGAVRTLADEHPDAVFVPGHGPLATATDLRHYADYLERLYEVAEGVTAARMSRAEGLRSIRQASSHLSILPSFHGSRLSWATPGSNLGGCCQLVRSAAAGSTMGR